MPRITPLSRKILIKKLKKLGFAGPLSATRHEYMSKEQHKVFIPNPHGGKDIGVSIIKAITDQLGISRDNFLNL
ncbi:MAG: type II toxin-antitoxin system HicA family toxin [Candidatus Kuenenbacteria bacterium]